MQSIRIVIASLTFAAAGLVQAQEVTPFPVTKSSLDRAAVTAEAHKLLAEDRLVWGNEGSDEFRNVPSKLSRAAVQREARITHMTAAEFLRYGM